jgi:dTDP-4-dehydrorhamnose reductase
MAVLVVGASGYLGSELAAQASAAGHQVVGTSTTGSGGWLRLDVTDLSATHQLLASVRPQLVINTAYRNTSWTVCADGAANVALAAAAVGARLVHISSDALHAGRPTPYLDDDEPTPVHMYGAAKAAAETAVAAIMPDAPIVRTSLIIGDERSQQIRFTRDIVSGRTPGAMFSDEFRRPVHVQDLAAAVLELDAAGYAGRVNVAGPETVSRVEFGRLVAKAYGMDPDLVPVSTIAESGLGARPANVLLDSSRAAAALKTHLRPVSECIGPPGL